MTSHPSRMAGALLCLAALTGCGRDPAGPATEYFLQEGMLLVVEIPLSPCPPPVPGQPLPPCAPPEDPPDWALEGTALALAGDGRYTLSTTLRLLGSGGATVSSASYRDEGRWMREGPALTFISAGDEARYVLLGGEATASGVRIHLRRSWEDGPPRDILVPLSRR